MTDDYLTALATPTRNQTTARSTAVTARRYEVAKMYLSGYRQPEIAEHFGVVQPVISRDLLAIRKAWIASAIQDFSAARGKELAKIDNLEEEYWSAWRRSQRDAEMHTTTESDDKTQVTDRSEGQTGDPRYLSGVQWCIERRCALLGLDQPKTIGVMIGNKTLDKATDTELTLYIVSQITALLQPEGQAGTSQQASQVVIEGESRETT